MKKLRLILMILWCCFCLIFTQNIMTIVSADTEGWGTGIVTIENWDSYQTGVTSGSNLYITWYNPTGYASFLIANDWSYSGTKSLSVNTDDVSVERSYGNISLNHEYSYISSISFRMRLQQVAGDCNGHTYVRMDFYNKTNHKVLSYAFSRWASGNVNPAYDWSGFGVYDYTNTLVILNGITFSSQTEVNLVITHVNDPVDKNLMNYSLYNNTGGLIFGSEETSNTMDDWTSFSYIKFFKFDYHCTGYHAYSVIRIDDIVINTSGYGAEPGSLSVNAYDEVTGSNISDFSLLITNQTGTTFFADGLNNKFNYPSVYLPQGTNVMVTIYATGYYPRNYLVDIYNGYFYVDGVYYSSATINAYLPQVNISYQYLLTVINPFQVPIENVSVIIKGSIANASYEKIYDVSTDGAGQTSVFLIAGRQYQVTLSKSGYNTTTEIYIPSSTVFSKTFSLAFYQPEVPNKQIFADIITYTGTMYSGGYIHVYYNDSNSTTINTTVNLYDKYNDSRNYTNSRVGKQSFTENITGINTSRTYRAELFFNNTNTFDITSPVYITIYPLSIYTPPWTKPDFGTRVNDVIGPPSGDSGGGWSLGSWSTIITVAIALTMLMIFGPYNAGLGLVACGFSLTGTEVLWAVMFSNATAFNILLGILGPVVIFLGVLYMMTKGEAMDKL